MDTNIVTDVVVLGGGPGGYTAAFRAADLGLKVCLVEQESRLGGVCLNVGCIPSKTLLHAAAVIEETQEAEAFGVRYDAPEIDLDALREHKNSIITQLTGGLDGLCKSRKITRLEGKGVFSDDRTLAVTRADSTTTVSFGHAVIATGSHPFVLPDSPGDERIWDSSDALALQTIPKRLLIIGGGIIGLEMAQVYHALGSEITIVEMLDHIIPPADKDLVQPLFLKLKKRYTIHTQTRVESIKATDEAVRVMLSGAKGSEENEYDAVLTAVGRSPNSDGIGLEKLGIEPDERGFIPVNERQETANPNIFAIGDVVGNPMLAHKATHQGKTAAEVIAGHKAAFTPMTIPFRRLYLPGNSLDGSDRKRSKRTRN